jgi:ABC-type branched-subunit amino acid transport system ATPase component
MALLEINNLRSGYGNIDVLDNINMNVTDNRITGIIGPNGTGKSTLLKSIIGIASIKDGEILYRGEPLDDVAPSELVRRGITYMPQGDRVFPDMTVHDNLRMGGYVVDSDEFEAGLEEVYELYPVLEEKTDQPAHTLSGGQQTMLSFGMALVNRPKLILLDEPSAGLAPNLVDELFVQIRRLRDQGIPFLIVEQSVRALLENCDHVYVIEEGTTVFDGPPNEIREREDLMEIYLALEGTP